MKASVLALAVSLWSFGLAVDHYEGWGCAVGFNACTRAAKIKETNRLRAYIKEMAGNRTLIRPLRFVLIGKKRVGKSATVNTCMNSIEDRTYATADCWNPDYSKYKPYAPVCVTLKEDCTKQVSTYGQGGRGGKLWATRTQTNVQFMDIWGSASYYSVNDVRDYTRALACGHIPAGMFKDNPAVQQKLKELDCGDLSTLATRETVPDAIWITIEASEDQIEHSARVIKGVKLWLTESVQPIPKVLVVVTKVDRLDKDLRKNPQNLLTSKNFTKYKKKLRKATGLRSDDIFPIINSESSDGNFPIHYSNWKLLYLDLPALRLVARAAALARETRGDYQ